MLGANTKLVILTAISIGIFIAGQVTCQSSDETEADDAPPAITAPEFSIDDVHRVPCVLVKINATLVIEPKRTANRKTYVDVPRSAEAKGSCGKGQDSSIIIYWNTFKLLWNFRKTESGNSWYVHAIQLSYNTSDKHFQGKGFDELPSGGQVMRTPDSFALFSTPIGKSYGCAITQEIVMMDPAKYGKVTIILRRIQIQPFAKLTKHLFGEVYPCPASVGIRTEAVPFAIGCIVAIAVLFAVLGYAGYRYFKVKKIEYDTME